MRAVVTGAAGFIGSTLTDTLLAGDHHVVGIDCFTPYYSPDRKRANLSRALEHPRFTLADVDLRTAPLEPHFDSADVVFHQAGQPGVRMSWTDAFDEYLANNVLATQRVLAAAPGAGVGRVVYASSSSVYGNAARYPTVESDLPSPASPYGITKLAAEHLCSVANGSTLLTVALRYFTVYGPRQRPDMAIHRAVHAALTGEAFPLYGDGTQRRDFTYVDDVVAACMLAAHAELATATVVNVAGGATVELSKMLELVEELTGATLTLDHRPSGPGDVHETGGAIDRAREMLGWSPVTSLEAGLAAQIEWQRDTLVTS